MKVIGTKYGIAIVKPWSTAMYDHNEKVADLMKKHIMDAVCRAYDTDDEGAVRDITCALTGHKYGFGYELDDIFADACRELDMVQNYWLHTEYPWLVKMAYCPALEEGFVGY